MSKLGILKKKTEKNNQKNLISPNI